MPIVERPGGVELSWWTLGEGPLVVIADSLFAVPKTLAGLEAELAADHTVLRYDTRGTGESTRSGPYDLGADVEDLAAVIEAAAAGPALAVGVANGSIVAVLCASRRPDLVSAVVAPTGVPIATGRLRGPGSLSGSAQVLRALSTQLASDYRGAIRSVTSLGNPQATPEQNRERVLAQLEYCPQEAAQGRFDAWIHSDPTDEARGLGDRLWILLNPHMPWWPVELADPVRELLPEAHVEVLEDGPISRPDLTADRVRAIAASPSGG